MYTRNGAVVSYMYSYWKLFFFSVAWAKSRTQSAKGWEEAKTAALKCIVVADHCRINGFFWRDIPNQMLKWTAYFLMIYHSLVAWVAVIIRVQKESGGQMEKSIPQLKINWYKPKLYSIYLWRKWTPFQYAKCSFLLNLTVEHLTRSNCCFPRGTTRLSKKRHMFTRGFVAPHTFFTFINVSKFRWLKSTESRPKKKRQIKNQQQSHGQNYNAAH